jgi:hypothetical protein
MNEALRRLMDDERFEFLWSDYLHRWLLGRHEQELLIPEMRFHGVPPNFRVMRIVEDANREYAPLDRRVLDAAAWGDPWRRPGGQQDILDEIQAHNTAREAALEQKMQDAIDYERRTTLAKAEARKVVAYDGQKETQRFREGE